MNVKMLKCITASALLCAALYPLYSTAAGKEEKCPARRPLSRAEQKAFQDVLQAVRGAMPAAPEGWTAQEQDPDTSLPGSICEERGFPLESAWQVSYTNEKKIVENIRSFERSRSTARVDRLAEEMSEAAERGDSKKLRKLQDELDGLNAASAGAIAARILVRINPAKTAGSIRGGSEFPVPGAKYAWLVEEKKGKRLLLYVGRWNRRGEFGIYPDAPNGMPNVSVRVIEIIIEGDIAEQLAKVMDLKAIGALLR